LELGITYFDIVCSVDSLGITWYCVYMPITIYPKQRVIFDYLKQYMLKNGFAPSVREITKAVGLRSLATVHEHLKTLEKKGLIRREQGVGRSIEIAYDPEKNKSSEIEVNLLGYIQAGKPIEPVIDGQVKIAVSSFLVSGKARTYVLKVKGESMIEDGIFEDDYVVVEEQNFASNGDLVIALLENGLATLKRFYKEIDRIRLQPANSTMAPIYATDVTIQGKVVGLIRKY